MSVNYQASAPPAALDMRRRLVFLGLCAGNFMVLLDTSILNVALPNIQQDLNVSDTLLPWSAVAYTIAFSCLLLASGAVADRFGAPRLYRTAAICFGAISLLCAAAPSIGVLIGSRVLLGVAAAGMVPASLAVLASVYDDPKARMRAIGSWAAVSSSGLLAGPLLGGLLVAAGGWRLIFVINPFVAALSLALIVGVRNTLPAKVRPFDWPGVILSVLALALLTFGLIDGGTNGWSRPGPIVGVTAGILALAALAWVERRVRHPVLPPELLARRSIRSDMLAATVATLVFYGMLFTLTLWYERERGFSALATGLAFVPMTLPMCVLPMITGRLVARFGARKVILFGLTSDVLAGILLAGVGHSGPLAFVLLAEAALVLASTTTIPAATAHVGATAPAAYAASAQGALNAGRQAGSALGVALLGPLTSLHAGGAILAVISVLTLAYVVWSGGGREPAVA
jgi:DHA2 family methylenomycin A resistance protein-like MFS transporter